MSSQVDSSAISSATEDVRCDKSDTDWAVISYEDKKIVLKESGAGYENVFKHLDDSEVLFIYARFITGDEMSKRTKFVFITWVGQNAAAMKKAKTTMDKTAVKQAVGNFAVEFTASEQSDITEETVRDALAKAGGAAYGTGM